MKADTAFDFRMTDETDRRILRALQENARLTYAELGRRVGLTPPAVAERVRKMEEAGFITGYHARLAAERVGWPVGAFISLKTTARRYPEVTALVGRTAEMLECHHVSGEDSFIIRVVASSMAHLETLISLLSPLGATSTAIVLSSPVVKEGLPIREADGAS